MKIFIGLFVGCLYLASVQAGKDKEEEPEPEPWQYVHRFPLGHFKESPFIPLYGGYVKAFVLRDDNNTPYDDYQYFSPTGDMCVNFFRTYRVMMFQLRDIHEFIMLDACLGYLFDKHRKSDEYQQVDMESSAQVRAELPTLLADNFYRGIFENTTIDEYPIPAKKCIASLLYKSIQVKHQHDDVACNDDWLQMFLDFARCRHTITADEKTDSYLNILADLVKTRARKCFFYEINILNTAVGKKYDNNFFWGVQTKTLHFGNTLLKQANVREWPKQMVTLLTAVQDTGREVSVRRINAFIRAIRLGENNHKARFLQNLAKFANKAVSPLGPTKGDPTGNVRYKEAIDKMCNYFRPSDNKHFFDFASPFVKMVEMLKYPNVFNLTNDDFLDHVVREGYATAPLYYCVSSCNILTFTEGQFVETTKKSSSKYVVAFKPNTEQMILWPDAGSY